MAAGSSAKVGAIHWNENKRDMNETVETRMNIYCICLLFIFVFLLFVHVFILTAFGIPPAVQPVACLQVAEALCEQMSLCKACAGLVQKQCLCKDRACVKTAFV